MWWTMATMVWWTMAPMVWWTMAPMMRWPIVFLIIGGWITGSIVKELVSVRRGSMWRGSMWRVSVRRGSMMLMTMRTTWVFAKRRMLTAPVGFYVTRISSLLKDTAK